MEMELWLCKGSRILKPVSGSLFMCRSMSYPHLYAQKYMYAISIFISGLGAQGSQVKNCHFTFYVHLYHLNVTD